MADQLTPEKRARRYLQASMKAGYTGLPAEHREAYEEQMRSHERAYPRVREHALAGASADFDKPLGAGEREHQRELRSREGMQQADVQRIRRELRDEGSSRGSSPRRGSQANPTFAGPRAARRAAKAGAGVISTATGGSGNTILYFIGVALGLSLLYLLVAGKGAGAVTGIVGTIVAGVGAFIKPEDPIAKLEGAFGAAPVSSSSSVKSPTGLAGVASDVTGAVGDISHAISGYVAPFSGAKAGRVDMGQDFSLKPGAPIRAIGDAIITAMEPNWYKGQPLIAYELQSGPQKGHTVYVAEQITPSVRKGQRVAAGQVIGVYAKSGTGIEIGWGARGGKTLAQATTGYSEGQETTAGKSFSSFLQALGVPTK